MPVSTSMPWPIVTTSQATPTALSPTTSTTITVVQYQMLFSPTSSFYYHMLPVTATAITGWYGVNPPTLTSTGVWHVTQPPVFMPATRRPALARPAIMAGRKALRRSIDLFRMLRSQEEVTTFLSGQPLIVRGRRYDYRLRKRDNLLHHTMNPRTPHIPYSLELLDKDTGKRIAYGCVIIPDTPVIDQVLALILHVQDPEQESVVLNKTNWSPALRMAA